MDRGRAVSGEEEGVVCGIAKIRHQRCAVFVMEPGFMMGSMGSVVGEKIARLFEYAAEHELPVVGFTASGGARMQEGILSLMQMAKTSGAVEQHSKKGGLYITVLTVPDADGKNQYGHPEAQRCRTSLCADPHRPDNRRRDGKLCYAGGYYPFRAKRNHWLCRQKGH